MELQQRISDRTLPPVFIAEIGISHEGNFYWAKRAIKHAAESDLYDGVKFQLHIASEEMRPNHPWYKNIERTALDICDLIQLSKYARDQGPYFICTPFSNLAVEQMVETADHFDALKIGSGEADFNQLVDRVASEWEELVIVSEGMNRFDSVTLGRLLPCTVLSCVSDYPPPPPRENVTVENVLYERDFFLRRMHELEGVEPGSLNWGYSNHFQSVGPCAAAATLGARVFEIHFLPGRKNGEVYTRFFIDSEVCWNVEDSKKNIPIIMDCYFAGGNCFAQKKKATAGQIAIETLCERDEAGLRKG